MHPNNLEVGKLFGKCSGFMLCTGAHYLIGYIRDDKSKGCCLKIWTNKWDRTICAFTATAENILRKVTPWWTMQSNQSGYLCNV